MIRFSLKQSLTVMGFAAFFCFLFRRPIDYLIQHGAHYALLNSIRPHLWLMGFDSEYYIPKNEGINIICGFAAIILGIVVTALIISFLMFCIKGIWEWAKN